MRSGTIALVGFGNVGQAFARLLLRKKEQIRNLYGFDFRITGIATGRHGFAVDFGGLDLDKALAHVANGQSLDTLSKQEHIQDTLQFIRVCSADVILESTPVNYETGQPALDYLREALKMGKHAVTANKGPVVHGYQELTQLAQDHQCGFLFESAVMDGAPVFSVFREPLPAIEVQGFTGILNSCTNLLLDRMAAGETLDEAIIYAQSIGIAETDPAGDVDGWDAAVKVAALVTVVMGMPMKPQEVKRVGIREISLEMIREAAQAGERWKLVCSAERVGEKISTRVEPARVESNSPLYNIGGTSSYVQFKTDVLPGLGIVESDPGPETTAYGMLADLINAFRNG
jgi:homoserine dehydrogenase